MGLTVYGGGGKPEEEKTVTAGTSVIEVNPSSGKAMKKVTVHPTPTESKSVTPTTSELTVTPSEGKHLSQVVVGAVEDVTPEVTAQTPVITQILEGLVGKAQGANATADKILEGYSAYVGQNLINGDYVPHGAYAWKKYTTTPRYVENSSEFYKKVVITEPQNAAITYEVSTTYTFDKNTGLFTLGSGGGISIAYDSSGKIDEPSKYYMIGTRTGTTMYKNDGSPNLPTLYNNAGGVTILAYNDSHLVTEYRSELIYEKSDFIDFVVSDSPTAYPDGGLQDGYWYEKVSEFSDLLVFTGCTKMAVDKITFAGDYYADNREITHTLGVIPKIALLVAPIEAVFDGTSAPNTYMSYILGAFPKSGNQGRTAGLAGNGTDGAYATTYGNYESTATTSTVKFRISSSSYYYRAGIEYTLITMA